jgi:glycosyltransferase involved in cell wall biosynthesis
MHVTSSEVVDGISLWRHPGAGSLWGMIRGGADAVSSMLKKMTPDLVHSHFAYAELGPRMRLPEGVPWVRTFHGPWDAEGWMEDIAGTAGLHLRARCKKWIRRIIEKRSLKRARKVIVLSEYSFREARALGVVEERLHVIRGGSDLQRFHPGAGRHMARTRLGLSEGGPLLLTVRRLVPRMGVESLVRAMPQVLQQCPGAQLIIGGRGPEHARLQALIRELGLEQRVTLAGFLPDEQLADYYRAADLFVLPTLSLEGFGLVTVDALACGTPVLGTPAGATPEILGPLDRRLITKGTGPTQLAEGIVEFWKSAWRHDLTADRLHAHVQQRYTWEQHTAATMAVYDEVLRDAASKNRTP